MLQSFYDLLVVNPTGTIQKYVWDVAVLPLGSFHSADSEPYASPALSECERRNHYRTALLVEKKPPHQKQKRN